MSAERFNCARKGAGTGIAQNRKQESLERSAIGLVEVTICRVLGIFGDGASDANPRRVVDVEEARETFCQLPLAIHGGGPG